MRTVSEKYALVQNSIWMISISFRQKRSPHRSVSDCSRSLNCLYRKQSENCRLSPDRGFNLLLPPRVAYTIGLSQNPFTSTRDKEKGNDSAKK